MKQNTKRKAVKVILITFTKYPKLSEDQFWGIIDQSLKISSGQKEQYYALQKQLKALCLEELLGFDFQIQKLMAKSYSSHLWCAANLMKGFCSDDSFDYFRYWLIASGKKIYCSALTNPDNLAEFVKPGNDFRFEEFGYVAGDALHKKYGVSIYDFDDIRPKISKPKIKLTWSGGKPRTMKKLCPRLYDLYFKYE
jgi:hypothetical protein